LTEGKTYTFRLTGKCVADGKTQSFTWDYKFTHCPFINDYDMEEYGMYIEYEIEHDFGDVLTTMLFYALSDFDIKYRVELLNTDKSVLKSWDTITVKSETYKENSFNASLRKLLNNNITEGPYPYKVYAWVELTEEDIYGISRLAILYLT
jgi:hypothetical protein